MSSTFHDTENGWVPAVSLWKKDGCFAPCGTQISTLDAKFFNTNFAKVVPLN